MREYYGVFIAIGVLVAVILANSLWERKFPRQASNEKGEVSGTD